MMECGHCACAAAGRGRAGGRANRRPGRSSSLATRSREKRLGGGEGGEAAGGWKAGAKARACGSPTGEAGPGSEGGDAALRGRGGTERRQRCDGAAGWVTRPSRREGGPGPRPLRCPRGPAVRAGPCPSAAEGRWHLMADVLPGTRWHGRCRCPYPGSHARTGARQACGLRPPRRAKTGRNVVFHTFYTSPLQCRGTDGSQCTQRQKARTLILCK